MLPELVHEPGRERRIRLLGRILHRNVHGARRAPAFPRAYPLSRSALALLPQCMFGEARETGATYQNASGPTFYEYTCCASGDNTGPACGDNDGSGWIGGGQWAHASNITIGYCADTSGAALSSSGKSCDDDGVRAVNTAGSAYVAA